MGASLKTPQSATAVRSARAPASVAAHAQLGTRGGLQVTVHRGHILTGGDPAAGKLVFEDAAGEEVAVEADLVVAADGPRSLTQALLQQNVCSTRVFHRQRRGCRWHRSDCSSTSACAPGADVCIVNAFVRYGRLER